MPRKTRHEFWKKTKKNMQKKYPPTPDLTFVGRRQYIFREKVGKVKCGMKKKLRDREEERL